MTATDFRDAENLKFEVLATGITIDDRAMEYIEAANGDRPLTPADYASTSGVILQLEGDVWVNAPIRRFNPNFVDAPEYSLTSDGLGLVLQGGELSSRAWFWLPPAYHGWSNVRGDA